MKYLVVLIDDTLSRFATTEKKNVVDRSKTLDKKKYSLRSIILWSR